MSPLVSLTDAELSLLDGKVGEKAQAEVAAAIARLASEQAHADLRPELAHLIADAVTEARTNGELRWFGTQASSCSLGCDKKHGYFPFKSGPNRGLPNYKKPKSYYGIEMAARFVRVQGHITVGGCQDCVVEAKPALIDALADIEAQLPDALVKPGNRTWTKHNNRRCPQCGWEGHEGECRKLRTLMGDGWYPGGCPSCDFEAGLLGRQFENLDGFTLVEHAPAEVVR